MPFDIVGFLAGLSWNTDTAFLAFIAAVLFNAGVVYAAFRNTVTKLDLRLAVEELKTWSDERYVQQDRGQFGERRDRRYTDRMESG